MKCQSIKPQNNRVCVAGLKHRIKIQYSYSSASNEPNINATVGFKDLLKVWARAETRTINQWINGVNVSIGSTVDFYIRWTNAIDFERELWVEFQNEKFKVSNFEEIGFEKRFMIIRCQEKGNKTIQANLR